MQIDEPLSPTVAAIIITYHPDAETLGTLISTLQTEKVFVIVVDNGGGKAALAQRSDQRVSLLDMGGNLGIGAAINAGIELARQVQCSHVVTFDQDSRPLPGMIGRLLAEYHRQERLGIKVGGVGPLFVDQRQTPPLVHPFIRLALFGSGHHYCTTDEELIPVDTLITSGCMTSISVLTEVGTMNPGLFVDYTDIEWCFRAKAKGFALFGVCGAHMVHELGQGASRSILGLNLFEYSPVRRYYYARNTIATSALPYVPFRWKLRLVIGLGLRCITLPWAPRPNRKGFSDELKMLLHGIADGLRGITGPIGNRSSGTK